MTLASTGRIIFSIQTPPRHTLMAPWFRQTVMGDGDDATAMIPLFRLKPMS
jgi:hypothetical protein